MATEAADWSGSASYSRYWRHYQQAMGWYQKHRRAYGKALTAAHGPPCYGQRYPGALPSRAPRTRHAQWGGPVRRGEKRHRGPSKPLNPEEQEEQGFSDDEDSQIECDVSNMEITEELRQYFAQTEKHREELRRQQALDDQEHASYLPADQDLHRGAWLGSTAPPHERPGARRGAEMKKLFGAAAAKIQAMEASLQLTFDRNCDRKQPKYWPVIPLRL